MIAVTYVATHAAEIGIGAAVGAAIGGTTSAITGGNILQGMAMGAISGAFIGGAGGYGLLAQVTAGAAGGGVNAAVFGGNIGQGMLFGAAGAAAGYGLGQIGIKNPYLNFGVRVAGGGVISGSIAALSGGNFGQGFAAGAVGAAMGYGIGKLMEGQSDQVKTGAKSAEVADGAMCVAYNPPRQVESYVNNPDYMVAGPGAPAPKESCGGWCKAGKTFIGGLGYAKAMVSFASGPAAMWATGNLTGNPYLVGIVAVETVPTGFYAGIIEFQHSWDYIKETWSEP